MKKFLAFVIIVLAGMTTTAVFASAPPTPMRQRPVTRAWIDVDNATSGGGNYHFGIWWERPPQSAVPDLRVPPERVPFPGDIWTLFPTAYDVRIYNRTNNAVFPRFDLGREEAAPVNPPPGGTAQDISRSPQTIWENRFERQTFPMEAASLYEVVINPIRSVPALGTPPAYPPGQEAPIISAPAVMDDTPPQGGLLFLTDITPTGYGHSDSITITWENPTFRGQNIFPYWSIVFEVNTDTIPPGGGRHLPPMRVGGVDAPEGQISISPDGRTLSATFSHTDIPAIGDVAVAINPLLGNNPGLASHQVRRGGGAGGWRDSATVIVGTHSYELFFTRNDYLTVVTMVPQLNVEQAGAQFIRLWWPPLGALAGAGLTHIEIEEWHWAPEIDGTIPAPGTSAYRILAVRGGDAMLFLNNFFVGPGIPRTPRAFSLAMHFSDGRVERTAIREFYPHRADFRPYRPEIVDIRHHIEPQGQARRATISMEWLAFLRFPATPIEVDAIPPGDPWNGRILDESVRYEVFVSDSWDDLQRLTRYREAEPVEFVPREHLDSSYHPSLLDPGDEDDITWRINHSQFYISRYHSFAAGGGVSNQYISGNAVYFVAIRVVRVPGGQSSGWAYSSVFVPPLVPLPFTPEMISSPPVEIIREAQTEIDIAWESRYLEIMRPGASNQRNIWHTVVGVNHTAMDNNLIFGRSAAHINYQRNHPLPPGSPARHSFLNDMLLPTQQSHLIGADEFPLDVTSPTAVADFIMAARSRVESYLSDRWDFPLPAVPPIALRVQSTDGFSYEIHVADYSAVRRDGGIEAYMATINNTPGLWASIGSPAPASGVKNHRVTGLTENTTYVIFLRPYVTIGGEVRRAAYPTFVTGTTITTPDRPTPHPSTPVLIAVPEYTTRNRVAVRWRVQADMVYTLRVSQFFTDYPTGGTVINITRAHIQAALAGETVELENPESVFNIRTVNGEPYFHLRIHDRFPATTYYIWATAQSVNSEGEVVGDPSHPSNPVDIHTNDIEPPAPPRSFTRVPQNLLDLFNRYNSTEYRNDEPEAMTVSFMRIFEDLRNLMGELTPRADGGTVEGGSARPLNLPNLSATEAYAAIHIIRFEELIANREYYVRARTVLTVRRGQPDVFSYEIELADNEDFVDSVLFTIPPLVAEDAVNTRRANSVWVQIELFTGVTDDEFDGVHRPDQYPMPERDFEITYDRITQTLTWRFRTNQRGADGRLDQNADQRFITRLIQDNVFVFTIDLSEYHGQPIANREIILPESILRAFDGRRITLEILAGDKNIAIPPGAFDTAQTRAIQPGIGTYYSIRLNAVQAGTPPLVTNTAFATVPQRFSVSATNNQNRTANLDTFARPIILELPVERHLTPAGLSTGLFMLDTNTASWRDMAGDFSFVANSISGGVQTPVTFAGISRTMPLPAVPQSPANAPMERVATRLVITDMPVFDPARIITANEFNNIVNAIAAGNTSVTMNATLPAASVSSLNRARLYAPAGFGRATALDIMVRLYENRTRQILTPMTDETAIPGIQNADPALRRNLRVASDIGFLTGPLEAAAPITMGEMMQMVDIIILDANM